MTTIDTTQAEADAITVANREYEDAAEAEVAARRLEKEARARAFAVGFAHGTKEMEAYHDASDERRRRSAAKGAAYHKWHLAVTAPARRRQRAAA